MSDYKKISKPQYATEGAWKAAKGLQSVDNLKVSDYVEKLSADNIQKRLSFEEMYDLLYAYHNSDVTYDRQKEADIVSTRIAELLSGDSFTLSPIEYKYIHGYLFDGLIDHAGQYRLYNISKEEPVLNGDTVIYADYKSIDEILTYDFNSFKMTPIVNKDEVVERISKFTSDIWQVHPFEEGNTRATAVLIELFLNTSGFDVDNTLFADKAQYFRNALVRANYTNYKNEVYPDFTYLNKFFDNLLNGANHLLVNEELICFSLFPSDDLNEDISDGDISM